MTDTTPIPVLDLAPGIERDWDAFREAFERVARSGTFIGGPEVAAFESEVAAFLGATHAVALNSGTDALVIALRALGIGPGDEVITTPFTFFATAEAISSVGATPVFVDIEESSYNLDPALVADAVTERTAAIMPVHLYGSPARMADLMATAEKHGLAVVEDCAQSFGAVYSAACAGCDGACCDPAIRDRLQGRTTGTMGDVGAYSFFPSKNLGAWGDGGLLTTERDDLAEMSRKLRAHGGAHKYHNETIGYNSRLDALQAALLRVKLPHVAADNAARRAAALRYNALLADVDGVTPPSIPEGHVVHQYTVRIAGGLRDAVHNALADVGIQAMVYYPVPCHRLPVYADRGWGPYPVTERLAAEVLSLPVGANLAHEAQDRVVYELRSALS